MGKIALLACGAVLTGCASQPAPTINPVSVWCEYNQPRRVAADELAVMTLDAKRAAVAYNRRGELWCGWDV